MDIYDKKQYVIKTFSYLDERGLLKNVNPVYIYSFFEKLRLSESNLYNADVFFELYKSSIKHLDINESEFFESFLTAIMFFSGHIDVISINHQNKTDIKEWYFFNKIGE